MKYFLAFMGWLLLWLAAVIAIVGAFKIIAWIP